VGAKVHMSPQKPDGPNFRCWDAHNGEEEVGKNEPQSHDAGDAALWFARKHDDPEDWNNEPHGAQSVVVRVRSLTTNKVVDVKITRVPDWDYLNPGKPVKVTT
jgi:hypothetical protein